MSLPSCSRSCSPHARPDSISIAPFALAFVESSSTTRSVRSCAGERRLRPGDVCAGRASESNAGAERPAAGGSQAVSAGCADAASGIVVMAQSLSGRRFGRVTPGPPVLSAPAAGAFRAKAFPSSGRCPSASDRAACGVAKNITRNPGDTTMLTHVANMQRDLKRKGIGRKKVKPSPETPQPPAPTAPAAQA